MEHVVSALAFYPFRCEACGHRFRRRVPGARYVTETPRQRRRLDRLGVSGTCDMTAREASGSEVSGTGDLVELSSRGCALAVAQDVRPGSRMRLVFHPAWFPAAITVRVGIVRWARPGHIGVEFLVVDRAEAAQLRSAVLAARGYSPHVLAGRRAAPRARRGRRGRRATLAFAIAALAVVALVVLALLL